MNISGLTKCIRQWICEQAAHYGLDVTEQTIEAYWDGIKSDAEMRQ